MAFQDAPRRTEPYSIWERKHAFKHGFPFSDRERKYWCFKDKCDFAFSSLGRAAQHEKCAHSRHPLIGDYGDWLERMADDEEEEERGVKLGVVKEFGEDVTHQRMVKIGMIFFERAIRRGS